MLHVFAPLAEFIRELIVEGTGKGLDAARASRVRLGRRPTMTPERVRHARALQGQPENTISSIAELLGVSRTTIYKYVPELTRGRGGLTAVAAPELSTGQPALVPLVSDGTGTGVTACLTSRLSPSPLRIGSSSPRLGRAVAGSRSCYATGHPR